MQPSTYIDVGAIVALSTVAAASTEPARCRSRWPSDAAATYAEWFATLSDPTRVRLLHAVSTAPAGSIRVGDLADRARHQPVDLLPPRAPARRGRLRRGRQGRHRIVVSVNPACCTGLPHAADVVMGTLAAPSVLPRGSARRRDHPGRWTDDDLAVVRDIYAEGIATRNATFETEVPTAPTLADKWLPGHRWVAEQSTARSSAGQPSARCPSRELLRRCRRDQRLRHRVGTRARRRQGAAATARSTRPTPAACGPCRPRSSPRTAPSSRCTTPPATGPWRCAPGSPSSTACGATPCCSSADARPTEP